MHECSCRLKWVDEHQGSKVKVSVYGKLIVTKRLLLMVLRSSVLSGTYLYSWCEGKCGRKTNCHKTVVIDCVVFVGFVVQLLAFMV